MATPADPSESQGPNMTPMIDIVFNLVTFFLLSVDMSHRDYAALELPRAVNGVEDRVDLPGDVRRVVVNLQGDGSVTLKGRTYAFGGADRFETGRALDDLTADLRVLAREEPRDADGTSRATVMVRGDRTAKWRYVQWVMQACADRAVKIVRIQFAVEGKTPDQGPR